MTEHTTPPAYVDDAALEAARSIVAIDPRELTGGETQHKARIQCIVVDAIQKCMPTRELRDHPDFNEYRDANDVIIKGLESNLAVSRRDYDVMNRIREGLEQDLDALVEHVEQMKPHDEEDLVDWVDRIKLQIEDTPKGGLAKREALNARNMTTGGA